MKKYSQVVALFFVSTFIYALFVTRTLVVTKPIDAIKEKKSLSCAMPAVTLAAISCVQNGSWNTPSTWSNNVVPTDADDVTIGAGFTVTLSGSIAVNSITVAGILRPLSATTNFNITTRGIVANGTNALFEIGTTTTPYTGTASITLIGAVTNNVLFPGMGTKVIGAANGGTIRMEGLEKKSWTNLNVDVAAGGTQITLKEPVGWQVGDEIVIVSSRANWNEAEKRTITAISNGNQTVSFATPLAFPHVGTSLSYTRTSPSKTWVADIRAEVGVLSHNIKIQGDLDSQTTSFGGHMMAHMNGKLFVNNIELFRMGQKSRNGRYPIHWHMLHTDGTGQFIKNSSIHNSFNRAVTIHGTHGTIVENNFCYDHIGHGIFLENGSEINNMIKGNVVLLTKRPAAGEQITPSDNQFDAAQNRTPSSYWITNPNNSFTNNVAAGTQGTGFWYALAQDFMFESSTDSRFTGQKPAWQEVFGRFTGNKAHSCMNAFDIFDRLDRNHAILINASWDEPSQKVFSNNTWYANDIGIYSGGGGGRALSRLFTFSNDVFVENKVNTMLASYVNIDESVMVANSGYSLQTGERALHRIYDGVGTIKNTHVVGYNASNANFLSNFGADLRRPNHIFENITFDPQLPIRAVADDNSNTSKFTVLWLTVVKDKTGSLTGNPNSSIVTNHPFFLVGDETIPHNWINLYNTPRSYLHASMFYTGTPVLPRLSLTRTKNNTPTRIFYEKDNIFGKHQMSLIANDDFMYTYQFESLPTNKIILLSVTDATPGDSYIARYKDFGKLGGLTFSIVDGQLTVYSSLAALKAGSSAGYFRENNGDLYVKMVTITEDRSISMQWTTDFVVPPLDTDGDGYSDAIEIATASNNEMVRDPGDAADLGFNFANTVDGWQTSGTVGSASIANSSYQIVSNGIDPNLLKNNLAFDSYKVPSIFANVKSNVTGSFQLYWATQDDPILTESKSVVVNYDTANQQRLISFNLASHPLWAGKTITALRLDLPNSTGTSNIYSIGSAGSTIDTDGDGMTDIDENAQCRNQLDLKDFGINYDSKNDTTDDYTILNDPTFRIANGIVSGASGVSTTFFPNFWRKTQFLNLKGSSVPRLKLRIKASRASAVRFFWQNEDGDFAATRRLIVNYTTPGAWQELVLDLSTDPNWTTKTIRCLRIDPVNTPNTSFEIDWIRSFDYVECASVACETSTLAVPLLTENKWTYYGPAGSTNYLFAIEQQPVGGNTQLFDAVVSMTKLCDSNNNVYKVANSITKHGVFIAGNYWNINTGSLTPNGFVNIRFFPDQNLITSLNTESNTFFTASNASSYSSGIYFKTDNPLLLPNDIRPDGRGLNYSFFPLVQSSTGTFGGKNYVQFNTITNLNTGGGGMMQSVSNSNQNSFNTNTSDQLKGSLRYNQIVHKFEGFDGNSWVPLH